MKKFLLAAVLFTAFATSCKKDECPKPAKAVETAPMSKAFLVNTPITIASSGSGGYEYGLRFQVNQAGKVTKLMSKMPNASTYRVTLWDASVTPKVVLATANISQSAGTLASQSITAVSLTTGKDYFLSLYHNGPWYQITPIGGGSFSYPKVEGSISIQGYQWVGSATGTPQVFPTNNDNTYIAGMMDLEYQPD